MPSDPDLRPVYKIFPNPDPGISDRIEDEGDGYAESAVIGMRIEHRGKYDNARIKGTNFIRKDGEQFLTPLHQKRRDALIMKIQKPDAFRRTTERGDSRKSLLLSSFAPPDSFFQTDSPPALPEALRPWIVVAVRRKQDSNRNAGGKRSLQQSSASQRFIIGMGRNK